MNTLSTPAVDLPLPVPNFDGWQKLYDEGARVRCVRDHPPMIGFGKPLHVGDVVAVHSVCYRAGRYEVGVRDECAFYALEGYFELVTDINSREVERIAVIPKEEGR